MMMMVVVVVMVVVCVCVCECVCVKWGYVHVHKGRHDRNTMLCCNVSGSQHAHPLALCPTISSA